MESLINTLRKEVFSYKQSVFILNLIYHIPFKYDNTVEFIELKHNQDNSVFIGINKSTFLKLDLKEQLYLVAHTILHYTLQHDIRLENRNPEIFHIACNHVVDHFLYEWDYSVPLESINQFNPKFFNKSAEYIYDQIYKENPSSNQNSSSNPQDNKDKSAGNSTDKDSSGNNQNNNQNQSSTPDRKSSNINKAAIEFVNASYKQLQNRGIEVSQIASQNGSLNAHTKSWSRFTDALEELIAQTKTTLFSWQKILYEFLSQRDKVPNRFARNYLPYGFYFPAFHKEELPEIFAAIDVSGSVSRNEINQFLSEIQSIIKTFPEVVIKAKTFNTGVQEKFTLTAKTDIDKLRFKINGGTDLNPVFTEINKGNPELILVFSDLNVPDFPQKPNCPVIWYCINDEQKSVPYGHLFQVTQYD